MIIGSISTENKAYKDEMMRIDVSKSIVTPDEGAITSIEIKANASAPFISVDLNADYKFIDWIYTAAANETITLLIKTTATPLGQSFTKVLSVVDSSTVNTFSEDSDLIPFEPDVMKHLPEGWSKFTRTHLRSQKNILDWLDSKRVHKSDGSRYQAIDVVNVEEVRQWSIMITLSLIYEGLSNQLDDVFYRKAKHYAEQANWRATRAEVTLQIEGATVGEGKKIDLASSRIVRQ